MAEFKGGRGKKAGYETQMYRIPVPLKPTVERLGLQFRLLWDGLIDPRGEKLISRIEAAIPDPEQLGNDERKNLISGKADEAIPDIKFKELGDKLGKADTAIDELRSQLGEQKRTEQALRRGRKELEQELEEANQEIERLQLQYQQSQAIKDSQGKQQEEIAQLRQALKGAGAMADRFQAEAGSLKDERDTLCSQLQDQGAKAGKWYEAAKETQKLAEARLQEIERLRNESQNRAAADPEAIALLSELSQRIEGKEKSYQTNSFSQGLKDLKKALAVLLHY